MLIFQGCLEGFETYLKDHLIIIGGVGVGIAFIQVCYLYLQRISSLCERISFNFVVCRGILLHVCWITLFRVNFFLLYSVIQHGYRAILGRSCKMFQNCHTSMLDYNVILLRKVCCEKNYSFFLKIVACEKKKNQATGFYLVILILISESNIGFICWFFP